MDGEEEGSWKDSRIYHGTQLPLQSTRPSPLSRAPLSRRLPRARAPLDNIREKERLSAQCNTVHVPPCLPQAVGARSPFARARTHRTSHHPQLSPPISHSSLLLTRDRLEGALVEVVEPGVLHGLLGRDALAGLVLQHLGEEVRALGVQLGDDGGHGPRGPPGEERLVVREGGDAGPDGLIRGPEGAANGERERGKWGMNDEQVRRWWGPSRRGACAHITLAGKAGSPLPLLT